MRSTRVLLYFYAVDKKGSYLSPRQNSRTPTSFSQNEILFLVSDNTDATHTKWVSYLLQKNHNFDTATSVLTVIPLLSDDESMDFSSSNTSCSHMPINYHATSFFVHSVEKIHTAYSNHRCTLSEAHRDAVQKVTTECTHPHIPFLPG